MNFFLIDALAYSTRFGIITQLEIRTESQLALENEFFSDRRLSPLDTVRGLSYYQPARDSNQEPTCIGKIIFFSDRRLSPLDAVRGSLVINQLEIRNPTRLEFEIFFFYRRLSLLDAVRGLSLIITQLENSNWEPTCIGKWIFFRSTPLPTRLFGALLLSPSSRFEPRANLHRKMNFFLIDAFAHYTRFGALLLSIDLLLY